MAAYVGRRLIHGVVIVFAVATITFILLHIAPGDPFTNVGESDRASVEVANQMRHSYGLDRPIGVQYVRYLAHVARGDFGISFAQHRPVIDVFRDALPNTVLLAVAALIVDFAVGIGIALMQAARAGSLTDHALGVASLTLYSTPVFWLGLMLLLLFGQWLGWFPIGGVTDPILAPYRTSFGTVVDVLHHLVLPAVTLGLVTAAETARYQRAALLDVLHRDFVRTARAKGLSARKVMVRHVLRNALLTPIALLGVTLPGLLSGTVLVETVFAWPGLGKLAADAIGRRDYPVVTAGAILAAVLVVIGNLGADLLTHAVDPRTRETA